MPIPELLGRLAGKCSWATEASGGSFGGLSSSDVAYTLSGLSKEHWAYTQVRYFHDPAPMPQLVEWILANTPDSRHSLPMAMLAILESVSPRKCTSCSGRGEQHHKYGRIVVCDRCRGSGNQPFAASERARLIGISRQVFQRKWANRYDNVYRRLSYLDSEVIRHVKSKLR